MGHTFHSVHFFCYAADFNGLLILLTYKRSCDLPSFSH
jgi:hypothetical protein